MVSIPTPAAPPPKKTVSPRHALLENLIGIVTRHVNDQFSGLTARWSAALCDVSDIVDARAVHQRFKAANMLKNNSYAFLHLAVSALEAALRKEIALLSPAPKLRAGTSAKAMTLVAYEEMDSQLAFSALSKPFDLLYSDQLATLNVRLAFLLDRDILRVSQNPFRPEVFLLALQQAWCAFEPGAESSTLFSRLLKPELFFDLGPMLLALNLALTRKGPDSADACQRPKADSHDALPKIPLLPDHAFLAQQLRQFFAAPPVQTGPAQYAAPGPATGNAGVSAPALPQLDAAWLGQHPPQAGWQQAGWQQAGRQPLLSYLARLQQAGGMAGTAAGMAAAGAGATPHNVIYLPGIKANAPEGSLTRADESTIDLLSRIFDTVFQDRNISQEIRDLIRFLQIPVLKAALADKDFFFQEAHPARRLIELLSRMGWEQRKGPQDPLFEAMQRSVDRVGRDAEHELSVFSEAVSELEASIQAEEKAVATAIAEPIASAIQQEKKAEATRSAKDAVALRIGTGEVLAVVETFLENKWVSVLTIAYSVEESKPGAIRNATRAMDELIWSVKPKLTADERKQLIGKLPSLLAALNKWLDLIQWQDADRLQFFAELAECHASIVRAPLELSAERRVEIALEVAQKAAEHRLELQNKAAQPEPVVDDAVVTVDMLQRGMWLEFSLPDGGDGGDGGDSNKVKLAWISPLRTLFIFSTSARQEAFSMSGDILAQRFRDNLVQVLRSEGVVGRALSQAMAEQGAVNEDSMAPRQSA
ncbi:MAG TPA: DUF1631 family protein [Janthinobacterium sp.]|nr:DUF1631 family protein [Janthinobacterium sp.]